MRPAPPSENPRSLNRRTWLAGMVSLAGAGCTRPPERGLMRIAAASDLQKVLPLLIDRFRADNPGEIQVTFGASGQLAEQVRQGAPFDLFLSASAGYVRTLSDAGVILPGTVQPYALGTLGLAVNRKSGVAVKTLADLDQPAIKRVAIANPDLAPYGLAAKQALEHEGLWARLEPKIARAETVAQAMQFVVTGNAEVGLVGQTLAGDPAVEVTPLPSSLHEPIVQAVGVVAASKHADRAKAFARFLVGGEAQGIFARSGFSPAGRPAEPAP